MTLQELVAYSHGVAKEKGWWDEGKKRSPMECLMLMVTELAEAAEELRKPHSTNALYFNNPSEAIGPDPMTLAQTGHKPEGFGVELADAVIRIADLCGAMGINLEQCIEVKQAYNETRGYRHGNKKY